MAPLYDDYISLDVYSLLTSIPPSSLPPITLICAERSSRWTPDARAHLDRLVAHTSGKVSVQWLANSGHWMHVDNLAGLVDAIRHALSRQS